MADPRLLEDRGYAHHFARDIWINTKERKIFSREAIEDHDDAWLLARAQDPSTEWTFYFNQEPKEAIKQDILKELGL